MTPNPAHTALRAVNHISAMVAYWDNQQRCVFSNNAYREWFGRSPDEMVGMSMRELLGALYEQNLPYILKALKGEKQVFERQIPLPNGSVRESIATYTPDIKEDVVHGFTAHVADVTVLREREMALAVAIQQRDQALLEIQTLRGLLPICAGCKSIRNESGHWQQLEDYLSQRAAVSFSHSMCPMCMPKYYPGLKYPGR